MRTITDEELKDILDKHKKWLNNKEGGERADLRDADLSDVNLYDANLHNAILRGANLYNVILRGADLSSADLRCAILQGTNLQFADLHDTLLQNANLQKADLQFANLSGANLSGADLSKADLKYVKRRWFVYTGAIGSRNAETLYFADDDVVRCGCWNKYKGGTLNEFKKRINEVYPADSEIKEHQRYRLEYLSAIKMFEGMREAYLDEISL